MALSRRRRTNGGGSGLDDSYSHPTFLIRRAHQVATSVFWDRCSVLDLTPSQYCVLFILRHISPVGQNELGRYACLDRSTTSLVVRILRKRELVSASADDGDKRKTLLSLTGKGRLLLGQAESLSTRASRELLVVFDEAQARRFVQLLGMLTAAHEARSGIIRGIDRN